MGMDEMLTDERVDIELGDVTSSFASPVPMRSRAGSRAGSMFGRDEDGEGEGDVTVGQDEAPNEQGREDADGAQDEDDEGEEGEKTVILNKRLPTSSLPTIPSPTTTSPSPSPAPAPATESEPAPGSPTPSHVSEISIDPDASPPSPSEPPQTEQAEPQLTESVSTPEKIGGSWSRRLKIKITNDVERIVVR